MLIYIAYILAAAAIIAMAAALIGALRLRRSIAGGEVGRRWGLLTVLLGVSFVGYLASPLILWCELGPRVLSAVTFAVFLGGAVFALVVVSILRDILPFLDLGR